MVDDLLKEAEDLYRRGRQYQQADAPERALVSYHDALEKLLRWSLIRDGAEATRAMDTEHVTWQDLVDYLDARHGVERQSCVFLSQMTHLREQVDHGVHPVLNSMTMDAYGNLVNHLFRRFFPRNEAERQEVAQRSVFARRRPVENITTMPPERAHDTPIMVPIPPVALGAAAQVAAPPAERPAWVDQLLKAGAPDEIAAALANAPIPPSLTPPRGTPVQQAAPPPTVRPEQPPREAARVVPLPPAPPAAATDAGFDDGLDPLSMLDELTAPPASADEETLERQRAIEAGQRLRDMRLNGLEYCPGCRTAVPMTASTCPHCRYDLAAARTGPAGKRAGGGFLSRLFGRR